MYCKNCGAKLIPSAKYCSNCGTPAVQDKKDYALGSLILGLMSFIGSFIPLYGWLLPILGMVFGFMGLKSSKRNFAIAGIVLSFVSIFITVGVVFSFLNYRNFIKIR